MRAWLTPLALVLFAAGCGGGDASSSVTAGKGGVQLTKAELIEQGNAICAKTYAALGRLNPEGTPREAVRSASLTREMVEHLLALGNPQQGVESSYGEYIHIAHELIKTDAAVESTAKRNNPNALKDAEFGSVATLSVFQNWANEIGLKGCDLNAYMAAEDSSQAP